MKKPDIKRLKYPLWFQLIFLALTVAVPAAVAISAGAESESTGFRWTYSVIVSLVLVWIFIHHFIVKPYVNKLRERQIQLEHDYEIDNGNQDKIKWIWFKYEIIYALFHLVTFVVFGALISITIEGIVNGLINSVHAMLGMIISCYLVAYAFKFVVILAMRNKEGKNNEESGTETETDS